MADTGIVQGLFGITPQQAYQQQQQQSNDLANQAYTSAAGTPGQIMAQAYSNIGSGLVQGGAGMMGVEPTAVVDARKQQEVAGKIAGMTVDQLRQYALTIPDPRMKMNVMAYADQKEAQQSTLAHQAAQTNLADMLSIKAANAPTGAEKIQILDRLKKSYPNKTDEELLRMIDKPQFESMSNEEKLVTAAAKSQNLAEGTPEWNKFTADAYQKLMDKKTNITVNAGRNNPYQLSDVQNEALFGENGAVTTGKLSPDRINSRSAKLLADAYIKNPNTDMVGLSATASLAKNPQIQQKSQLLMAIPEIMQNMVDSGKKVGFSDNRTVGKMQSFIKGEFNDPDYAEYMTQRNDALMTIAGVMRSNGMSDQAHKAEIEAASPTMNPAALDGWLRGQMKSLEPRLKIAQKFTRTEQDAPISLDSYLKSKGH